MPKGDSEPIFFLPLNETLKWQNEILFRDILKS